MVLLLKNEEVIKIKKNINCKKILYITEPIEHFAHYNTSYKLLCENFFDAIYGCINNNIEKKYVKYPLYTIYVNMNDLSFVESTNGRNHNDKTI